MEEMGNHHINLWREQLDNELAGIISGGEDYRPQIKVDDLLHIMNVSLTYIINSLESATSGDEDNWLEEFHQKMETDSNINLSEELVRNEMAGLVLGGEAVAADSRTGQIKSDELLRMAEASLNSSSQMRSATSTSVDWQEEFHQKIKSMHEMYYPQLNEMYCRVAAELQEAKNEEQLEKLKFQKLELECIIMFPRTNKSDIQPNHEDKVVGLETKIVHILNSNS